MLPSSTLLPTTFSLSGDAAIEAILGDIPLFCEGIMGIGIFTFLFVAKQVKWSLVFLYGSSLFAFTAATLDLTQVLTRGPDKISKDGSLQSLTGFLYGREIFLSLSLLALNLYYWRLVAMRPRFEPTTRGTLSFSSSTSSQRHSASWDRWGTLGDILKWASLACLLSVPLLQMLWRLLPEQRRYSSIYVADSVIQTTITIILILKCGLNIYLSPLDDWWKSSQGYIAPVVALLIGVGLSVGNLVLFAFTETTLGRFLRAVEVYILFLHSLHTCFMRVIDAAQPSNLSPSERISPWDPEKSQFRGIVSPTSQERRAPSILEIGSRPGYQAAAVPLRPRPPSWLSISTSRSLTRRDFEAEVQSMSSEIMTGTVQLVEQSAPLRSATPLIVTNPIGIFGAPPRALEQPSERPFTAASYYSVHPSSPQLRSPSPPPSASAVDVSRAYDSSPPRSPQREITTSSPLNQVRSPFDSQPGSQQGSITSFDELLRQQSELDKSIAALRLLSTQSLLQPSDSATPEEQGAEEGTSLPSRSVLTNSFRTSKGEGSPSRSEFSLSVFPEPPTAITEEEEEESNQETRSVRPVLRRKAFNDQLPSLDIFPGSATMSSATLDTGVERFPSAGTQYDVTSFIGGLTSAGPSSGSALISAEPTSASSGTLGPFVALRPMILASAILSAGAEPSALPSSQLQEASPTATSAESPLPLRPLLLGRPGGSVPPLPLPGRMVPLAQRRERGGTIASATRRPVIGSPRMNEESETAPDAFERPRPPPLIIK